MRQNVIIVEDDLTMYPLLFRLVSQIFVDAKIFWSVCSEEAKKIINENVNIKFDLIISDIFLAGAESGIDFLSSAEVCRSGAKKILISSACSNKLEEYYRNLLPETLFLSKPVNLLKCVSHVKKIKQSLLATAVQ